MSVLKILDSQLVSRIIQRFFVKNSWQKIIERDLDNALIQLNEDYRISESKNNNSAIVKKIADVISQNGFIILPAVLSNDVIKKLRSEFHSIIKTSDDSNCKIDRHEGAICVRVKPFFSIRNLIRYPATTAFFNATQFYEITNKYYATSKNGFEYMSEVFVHETPETNNPISGKLHWDRAQTLKFWIYIDDLPKEAGPMLIEPDSIERNKNVRIKAFKEKKELIGGVDNVVESTLNQTIALSGPAGSIMIHDTDASHGASEVKPGHIRRIMRGHCRAKH